MTSEGFAPAKVNLTLHVTGVRADGYHLLDSLVAFADVGDRVVMTPGEDLSLDLAGPFAPGVPADARNLMWRAADAVGWTGAMTLEKQLPHPAGIGGGSSDAATVLRLIKQQGYEIPAELPIQLGADVPVCLAGHGVIMAGIGETLRALPAPLADLHAVLVNPGVSVPTPKVFAELAEKANAPMDIDGVSWADPQHVIAWLQNQRNDIEAAACRVAPEIADVLDALSRTRNMQVARMSGSGATCFAVYPDKNSAHLAAYEIGAAAPNWWCVATVLS